MRINSDKTKVMVTSSSNADLAWNPELVIDKVPIKRSREYKFLGVTVSDNLRFAEHVDKIAKKCRKRNNILKCMATKEWGNSLETQRTLYLQYIRSSLENASSSWFGWISGTQLKKLQRIQNDALRTMAGLAKTCPWEFLHLETGIEPLEDRLKKNDEVTWDRYIRLPTDDARRQLTNKHVPTRLTTRHGFRTTTAKCFKYDGMTRDTTSPPLPPWMELPNLTFETVELTRKKDEYSSEELNRLTLNKIATLDKEIHIYTDGSTDHNQENGGSGVFIERDGAVLYEESFPAGQLCSSYTGESVALMKALEWIEENANEAEVLICTDSRSLQDALKENSWKDTDPWLKLIKQQIMRTRAQISLLWLPSHCEVEGNERADELAKKGAAMCQSNIPVTHSIVKAKIRQRPWYIPHKGARTIYGERRKPRVDIESRWPRKVRTLYARLRTGHCKELANYRWRIEKEDNETCRECDSGESETIEHVLCKCPAMELERVRQVEGIVTMELMVTNPEACRKILQRRFSGLRIEENPPEDTRENRCDE